MRRRILVFGSYVTDLTGRAKAFPKEGETLKGISFKTGPGGKGSNQAVAAKRANADVTFVTKIGSDSLGMEAQEFYRKEGLWGDTIKVSKDMSTGAALILVNENTSQNMIVVIGGACENFTEEEVTEVLNDVEKSDILLIQLETNLQPVGALLKHAKKHRVLTVLNPAPAQELDKELFSYVDMITPNETEAGFYTGVDVVDEETACRAARRFMEMGVGKVVITMGERGCYVMDGEDGRLIEAVNAGKVVDTTGAGDAFNGGFVAALSRGMDFNDAAIYGNAAAGISVTRYGTANAMPYQEEIDKVWNSVRWGKEK